jgi:Type IV secretory system Conjugative DNA transfer
MTTLNVHMKWIDSPAMQEAMCASDFSFAELKHTESTVYLVIPPEYLDTHARYLRLFITLALRAAGRDRKARHSMLFILDEFAALGELKVVATAAGVSSGSGVKLWPIIQNLTQLNQYGDNWEVFLANAGQTQIFAMNDQTTARYFSEQLGNHMAWRKVRTQQGYEWTPYSATLLRTGPELARESSRDSGKAVILFEGGEAALVRRAAYDRLFKKEQYDPNPYQSKPGLRSLAGVGAAWGELKRAVRDRLPGTDDVVLGLVYSRHGPRLLKLMGDSQGAVVMAAVRDIYDAPTEDAQGGAFNAAVDGLRDALDGETPSQIRTCRQVFSEYAALVGRNGPRNESERRNRQTAEKLAAYTFTFDGVAGGKQAAALPAPDLKPETGNLKPEGQKPEAGNLKPEESDFRLQVSDLPAPKPLKAPPLKKPRKPRAKKTTP